MPTTVFIGSYTAENEFGISVFDLDIDTYKFKLISQVKTPDASYLTIYDNQLLYAVNESGNDEDTLTAMHWDGSKLNVLNTTSAGGSGPCYITVSSNLNHIVAANYNDGSIMAVPVLPDGKLARQGQVLAHAGKGPNTARQESAHMHCTEFSPDGQYLLASDLGTDKVTVYGYDATNTEHPLNPHPVDVAVLSPGTGPRHIIFSPDGRFAYLVCELTAVIVVFTWANGKLGLLQEIKMMPNDFMGDNCAADIHFSPSGNFLYTSNRGTANQIIIYAVDRHNGMLSLVGRTATLGIGPRNFAIHSSGAFLMVAHQKSNDIRVFAIDADSGALTNTNVILPIQAPVCVKFSA